MRKARRQVHDLRCPRWAVDDKPGGIMASSAVAVEERRMSLARVFERGFSAIGGNWKTMFAIAFLFSALPGGVIGYASQYIQAGAIANVEQGGQDPGASAIVVGLITL